MNKAMTREEAIRRIKAWNLDADDMEVLSEVIPELKENEDSEDERIRRALISYLNEIGNSGVASFNGFSIKEYITYLEKQKERGEANFREGYLHGFEDAQKEQKPINNSTREKIISRATSEKQVVLISESSGEAEIGWDTRSLEDAKRLLEYGLAFINKNITDTTEKRKATETPQWMIDFLNDILSSCIIYDDYVRRQEYQSKVLGIIKWLENQKAKTPQWIIDFLKEMRPYSINKEEYEDYGGRIEFESKILAIIKWLEGNFIQQKEQKLTNEYQNWELIHEFVEKFGRIPKDEDELNALVDYVLKRQKPAEWSEEDNRNYEYLHQVICNYINNPQIEYKEREKASKELIPFWERLKSLSPQSKVEWSEEDKHRCKDAIYFLETAKKHYASTSEIELTIEWLKLLRPQSKDEIHKEKNEKPKHTEVWVEGRTIFEQDANTFVNTEGKSEAKLTGWVARDGDERIWVYETCPKKHSEWLEWVGNDGYMSIDQKSFPDLKWEDEPVEVEITIRKK